MKEIFKGLKKKQLLLVLFGVFTLFPGCSGEDQQLRQLVQQQAATIDSLNTEIIRLNDEIAYASKKPAENNHTWQKNAGGSLS